MKKVIIAGSRNHNISRLGYGWLEEYFNVYGIDELVCGEANGVDYDSLRWCKSKGIVTKSFPAEWTNFSLPLVLRKVKGNYEYNALAGVYRNRLMAEYATHLLVFPGGTGTDNMYKQSVEHGLDITDLRSEEWYDLLINFSK